MDIVKIDVWKNGKHFKIFLVYNTPRNKLEFEIMEIGGKTILMGDFNAHSRQWGYRDSDHTGRELENFIYSHQLPLIYNSIDVHSYMHYNGTVTNPDLVIVSSDLAKNVHRQVLEDTGFRHRLILSSILFAHARPGDEGEKYCVCDECSVCNERSESDECVWA